MGDADEKYQIVAEIIVTGMENLISNGNDAVRTLDVFRSLLVYA